jgi:GTP-binding protein
MKINQARFLQSTDSYEKCPTPDFPEYAFIGRSNVGKSSLINMLTERKDLAKTSQKPGKTQTINHFLINENWYLVDLPGYGYAQVSKSEREKWEKMIGDYLLKRENLFSVFVLVDSRIPPQAKDLDFMQYLGENNIPFSIIFTKSEKEKPTQLQRHFAEYQTQMLKIWEEMPIHFTTSSVSRAGKEDVLKYIGELNKQWAKK